MWVASTVTPGLAAMKSLCHWSCQADETGSSSVSKYATAPLIDGLAAAPAAAPVALVAEAGAAAGAAGALEHAAARSVTPPAPSAAKSSRRLTLSGTISTSYEPGSARFGRLP